MESEYANTRKLTKPSIIILVEIALAIIGIAACALMIWAMATGTHETMIVIVCGILITICIAVVIFLIISPDAIRAKQTDATLKMSRKMVDLMTDGMTQDAAQKICLMLLPSTSAIAVAITDTSTILGYAGYREVHNPQGAKIRTQATHDVITNGVMRVLRNPDEIGLPPNATLIKAAIIVPIIVGSEIRGTLKFYYKDARRITETQKSIASGLGALLATQFAAIELEQQRELATSMELKMLQNQINPHFLFNTINTIASLCRTDPLKARDLLREFAVFYRSTLENSQDKIPLKREIEQTHRYFMFEVARFGEDRLGMKIDLSNEELDVSEMEVPPFLLQPLVENAIKHAMPAEGRLVVSINSQLEDHDILILVTDDGVGMNEEQRLNIFKPHSQTGLGIAVNNIRERMLGYYGPDAQMHVFSKPGEGTQIVLRFPGIADVIRKEQQAAQDNVIKMDLSEGE